MDNRPIGIMDSGVGGLTVACVLKEKYPNEKFIFIGDTARNPYGNKSPEEVTFFAEEMKAFLHLVCRRLSLQVKFLSSE